MLNIDSKNKSMILHEKDFSMTVTVWQILYVIFMQQLKQVLRLSVIIIIIIIIIITTTMFMVLSS